MTCADPGIMNTVAELLVGCILLLGAVLWSHYQDNHRRRGPWG